MNDTKNKFSRIEGELHTWGEGNESKADYEDCPCFECHYGLWVLPDAAPWDYPAMWFEGTLAGEWEALLMAIKVSERSKLPVYVMDNRREVFNTIDMLPGKLNCVKDFEPRLRDCPTCSAQDGDSCVGNIHTCASARKSAGV